MAEREEQVPQEPDGSDQNRSEPEQSQPVEPRGGDDDLAGDQQAEAQPSRDQTEGFDLPPLSLGGSSELPDGIALLKDVNLDVKIELGRTRMVVDDVLRLSEGAVVELDKLAGDPVDIYVNGRHIARGEVLVLNENFCVRISEILEGAEAAAKQIADAAADAMSA